MSKIFRGTLFGGFRRKDVVRYLESLDARQKEDLACREREADEAHQQADAAYAELSAAKEAAANLRAALAAQRTENARLSRRTGQLEQQQAVLQENLREADAFQKRAASGDDQNLHQLSQLCDRLDGALLRLDELMRDSRMLETAAQPADDPQPVPPVDPVPAVETAPVHRSALGELLDRVKPR